jgi:tetratricopeptide repeat protein
VADAVTEQHPSGGALPLEAVAVLLERAARARREGDPAAARALLRALSAQQPDLPQVWFALATVAKTRLEQRRALERVIALDPQNALARRGLARMGAASASPQPAPADTADRTNGNGSDRQALMAAEATVAASPAATVAAIESTPALEPAVSPAPVVTVKEPRTHVAPALIAAEPTAGEAAPSIRWPLYSVIALSALVVLIAGILLRGSEIVTALRPAPTAALPGSVAEGPANATTAAPAAASTVAPAGSGEAVPASAATALPQARATSVRATNIPSPTAAPPTPSPSPQPTPRPALAPGQVVKQGQWHVILIRPEDAVVLDGSVGSFQPRGRFILALVAVGNDGQAPARLPADLFALVDGAGNRYTPLPPVSTAYLNSYGRGQHGDLSMEDTIPADGGNKSVPLIFDVPASARSLYLVVGGSEAGWPVGQ